MHELSRVFGGQDDGTRSADASAAAIRRVPYAYNPPRAPLLSTRAEHPPRPLALGVAAN